MRDRLAEIIDGFFGVDSAYFGVDKYELADHLLANGVIVPPCKVGDYVYHIFDDNIQAMKMSGGVLCNGGVLMDADCLDEHDMCECSCELEGKTCGLRFRYTDIGKTVFLTKEEAEQALKEREKV